MWSVAACSSATCFAVPVLSARKAPPEPCACAEKQKSTSVRIMTFNVQFYIQFSRVLAELGKFKIRYGPFSHAGLVKSLDGAALEELANKHDLDSFKNRPAVKGNFDAICEFMQAHRPDIVAIQEGIKGMDIFVEDTSDAAGYRLQASASADGQTCRIPKGGTMVNQVLLNVANPSLAKVSSWQLQTKPQNFELDGDCARCAAGLRVSIRGQLLDIVSIHLTGGRYDDKHWKMFRSQRWDEIRRVIDSKFDPEVPMLILGDFNAQSTEGEVNEGYGRSLGATSDAEMAIFKEYMVGVHKKLQELGWKPAYTKSDLPIPSSVFGGTVDWVYKSPNWPDSLHIVGVDVLDVIHASDAPWASYPAGGSLKLSLSDHNPVVFDIELRGT